MEQCSEVSPSTEETQPKACSLVEERLEKDAALKVDSTVQVREILDLDPKRHVEEGAEHITDQSLTPHVDIQKQPGGKASRMWHSTSAGCMFGLVCHQSLLTGNLEAGPINRQDPEDNGDTAEEENKGLLHGDAVIEPGGSDEDGEFSASDFDIESILDDQRSDTTSLRSSILEHSYMNGRRYHRYRHGRYPIPNDEAEQNREDMLHTMMIEATDGRLFYAPIGPHPQKIIDLGTGTGLWAIESERPTSWPERTMELTGNSG